MAHLTVGAMDNPFYFTLSGGAMWEDGDCEAAAATAKVELAPESVRYYNVRPASRSSSTHSLASSSSLRRRSVLTSSHRLSSYLMQGIKSKDMLDILIVSCKQSDTAELWVNFLVACFQQICKEEKRPPFKVACVGVDEVEEGGPGSGGSRLQIAVVCPAFVERLGRHPAPSLLASIVQPATVVAMLLGVAPATLDSHHLANVLRLEQWRKMVVKNQDSAFVGDFLGVSMDILSRSWQLQQAINQMKCDTDSAHFSLIPKKIKMCQNKVMILLSDPVGTSDKVTVSIERNGHKMGIPNFKRRNPYTLQFNMPAVCMQTSSLVSVNVERNGKSLGQRLIKCESRLKELEQLLKSHSNPIQFMCQSLGISAGNKEALDNFMTTSLQKNIPPHFNLISSSAVAPTQHSRCEELPTLLHLGAKFGLERLCWELLECPGGWQACQMKNSAGRTPAAIAEAAGHTSLAHTINSFTQMTELSSMYTYLKGMSEKPQVLDESNYLLPRPVSDTYCVPPAARPVSFLAQLGQLNKPDSAAENQGNHTMLEPIKIPSSEDESYQVPRIPLPVRLDAPPLPQNGGSSSEPTTPLTEYYRSPPAARPFTPLSVPSSPVHNTFNNYLLLNAPDQLRFNSTLNDAKPKLNGGLSFSSDQLSMKSAHISMAGSLSSKGSPQDELIEIINDFKNNVFTIAEVEKLVDAWRNRNDVQQSFRERQDQLEDMRQEYERIQRKLKDQMRRPTPLDKIKKFFSRKHKAQEVGTKPGRNSLDSVYNRPLSSLSLHSSSSSSSTGRISTGSGTSLGDSGTHSDQDDNLRRSEEFAFHERLQSVKERSETSGGSNSMEDEETPKELPVPPDTLHQPSLAEIHSTYVNCEPVQLQKPVKKSEILKQETVVQVHCANDERNYVNMKAQTEEEEEDPLQVLEDLSLIDGDQNKSIDVPFDSNSDEITVIEMVELHEPQPVLETAYVEIKPCMQLTGSLDLENSFPSPDESMDHPSEDMALLEQSETLLKKVAESLVEAEPLLSEIPTQDYMNLPPFSPHVNMRNKLKSVIL